MNKVGKNIKVKNNKSAVKLVETKNHIKLIGNNSCTILNIHRDTLDNTIFIHGVLYSDWINKVKDKSWCTKDILYRLAIIIKEAFPTNKIDWNLQFFMIECEAHNHKKFSEIRKLFDEEYGFEDRFLSKNDNLNFISKIIFEVESYFEHFTNMSWDKRNKTANSDNLKLVKGPIEDSIDNCPEIISSSLNKDIIFDEWKTKSIQALKAIGISNNPKQVIDCLSESLLNHYHAYGLKDSNDMHQHLMNYWNETMLYDCKIIASDGWSSKPKVILPSINDFENLNNCFKFTNDLVPKGLIINRYLKKEKEQLEAARLIKVNSQMVLTRFKEEHSGPNGYLTVVEKLNKVNIKTRIKKLKSKTNVGNELKVLNQYLDLLDRKNILNKAFNLIEKIIDAQVIMRYLILSEEEFKTLVVEDKWMGSLETAIKREQTEAVMF